MNEKTVIKPGASHPEDLQQALLDAMPHIAIIIKPHTHEILASNTYARALGAQPGTCCYHMMGNDSICPWCRADEAVSAVSEKHVEIEALSRIWDAHWIPVDSNRMIHYAFDITKRKKAEVALLDSEERFQRIAETITDYIYTVRFENDTEVATIHSGGCCMITGYTPEEFLRNNLLWIAMVHPDDQPRVRDAFSDLTRIPFTAPIEHRIIRKDGIERWVRNTPVVHFNENGTISSYDGVVQDITDRKIAELRLTESEKRYRQMFETSLDGIATTDFDGRILDCNNAYMVMLGYESATDVIAKSFRDVTPTEYHDLDLKMIGQATTQGHCEIYEKEYICANGERYTANVRRWLRRDATGSPVGQWVIARDITEKKKMDSEILRIEHLRSLSQLAGGIAHDFNNLLCGIFGYIDIAREFADSPDKLKSYLEKAMRSLHRARDLTERLLTFAKGDTPSRKLCSVASLLKDSVSLCLAGQTAKARLVFGKDLASCAIDAAQIGRVINNLLMNAVQAMPGGGTVTIKANNTTIEPDSALLPGGGNYVKVVIRDSGKGIPASIIEKVFDPFFTTKQKGTGLGLSICQSIIKKHDGQITITSREGKGTEVTLYLPASHEFLNEQGDAPGKLCKGYGKILIMDDEDFVLDIATQMLQGLGYSVETARHGEEAITKYSNALDEKLPFDAVILDLTIQGGLGGTKTCARLHDIHATVKIIASSGYSNDPVMANPEHYGFVDILKKPYIADGLANVLTKTILKQNNPATTGPVSPRRPRKPPRD